MLGGRVDGQMIGHMGLLVGRKADESLPCARGAGPRPHASLRMGTTEVPCSHLPRGRLSSVGRLPCEDLRRARVRYAIQDFVIGSGAVL